MSLKENPVVDDLLVFVAYEKDLPYRWAFASQRWNRTQGDEVYSKVVDAGLSAQRAYPTF